MRRDYEYFMPAKYILNPAHSSLTQIDGEFSMLAHTVSTHRMLNLPNMAELRRPAKESERTNERLGGDRQISFEFIYSPIVFGSFVCTLGTCVRCDYVYFVCYAKANRIRGRRNTVHGMTTRQRHRKDDGYSAFIVAWHSTFRRSLLQFFVVYSPHFTVVRLACTFRGSLSHDNAEMKKKINKFLLSSPMVLWGEHVFVRTRTHIV